MLWACEIACVEGVAYYPLKIDDKYVKKFPHKLKETIIRDGIDAKFKPSSQYEKVLRKVLGKSRWTKYGIILNRRDRFLSRRKRLR